MFRFPFVLILPLSSCTECSLPMIRKDNRDNQEMSSFSKVDNSKRNEAIIEYLKTTSDQRVLWRTLDCISEDAKSNPETLRRCIFHILSNLRRNSNIDIFRTLNCYWDGSAERKTLHQEYIRIMIQEWAKLHLKSCEVYGNTLVIGGRNADDFDFSRLWYNGMLESINIQELERGDTQIKNDTKNGILLIKFDNQSNFENVIVQEISFGDDNESLNTDDDAEEAKPLKRDDLVLFLLIGMLQNGAHAIPALNPLLTSTSFKDVFHLVNWNIAGISNLDGEADLMHDTELVCYLKYRIKYAELSFISALESHDDLLRFVEDINPSRLKITLGIKTFPNWRRILDTLERYNIEELVFSRDISGLKKEDLGFLASYRILNITFKDATANPVKAFIVDTIRSMASLQTLRIDDYHYNLTLAVALSKLALETLIINFNTTELRVSMFFTIQDEFEATMINRKIFFSKVLKSESIKDFVVIIRDYETVAQESKDALRSITSLIHRARKGHLTVLYQHQKYAEIADY